MTSNTKQQVGEHNAKVYAQYAKRHNTTADFVATNSMAGYAAHLEYWVSQGTESLAGAREVFSTAYPNTKADGPMNVEHWIN